MNSSKKIKALLLKVLTRKKTVENFDISSVKKVLFLRYDRIGDMIITTPVFRELKKNRSDIEISVLASKTNFDVIKHNPYVDKIYINHKHNFLSDLLVLFKIRKRKIDVCVEFDHSVVPHAIFRLNIIKPKFIISVQKDGRYGLKGSDLKLYDFYTPTISGEHASERWMHTLKPIGVETNNLNYDVFISKTNEIKALDFIEKIYSKLKIGFNFEGAVNGKKISNNKFVKFCNSVNKRFPNASIIVICLPEKIIQMQKLIKKECLNSVLVSYPTSSILDVAALISKLDIVVSPDTSIVHIASAFNIPVISIHENNNNSYSLFAPKSSISYTIFSDSMNSIENFDIGLVLKNLYKVIENYED